MAFGTRQALILSFVLAGSPRIGIVRGCNSKTKKNSTYKTRITIPECENDKEDRKERWHYRNEAYLVFLALAMICWPTGDISVELAGDTGVKFPPGDNTDRERAGVIGAIAPGEKFETTDAYKNMKLTGTAIFVQERYGFPFGTWRTNGFVLVPAIPSWGNDETHISFSVRGQAVM
jgi:hypothetical protein